VSLSPRFLQVSRTARYYDLGRLDAPALWYVLHGYGQSAMDFAEVFDRAELQGVRVVAPEALSRFYSEGGMRRHGAGDQVGASWMTREARLEEIHDYLDYLDQLSETIERDRTPGARIVLGFSQGVHTAARWVGLGQTPPTRLVAWGAPLPDDLPLEDLALRMDGAELTLVHGETDPAFGPAAAEAEGDRLTEAGFVVHRRSHPGGHRLSRTLIRELAAG